MVKDSFILFFWVGGGGGGGSVKTFFSTGMLFAETLKLRITNIIRTYQERILR